MKDIEIIAFDADDTLWSNEPFFQEIERKFADLLSTYKDTKEISAELFKTEMNNLESYVLNKSANFRSITWKVMAMEQKDLRYR